MIVRIIDQFVQITLLNAGFSVVVVVIVSLLDRLSALCVSCVHCGWTRAFPLTLRWHRQDVVAC